MPADEQKTEAVPTPPKPEPPPMGTNETRLAEKPGEQPALPPA